MFAPSKSHEKPQSQRIYKARSAFFKRWSCAQLQFPAHKLVALRRWKSPRIVFGWLQLKVPPSRPTHLIRSDPTQPDRLDSPDWPYPLDTTHRIRPNRPSRADRPDRLDLIHGVENGHSCLVGRSGRIRAVGAVNVSAQFKSSCAQA